MFEYVRWCSSVEELAKGKCRHVVSKAFKYSLKKSFNMPDFLTVKSSLFKTIHFLTISLDTFIVLRVLKLIQFFSALSDGVSLRRRL